MSIIQQIFQNHGDEYLAQFALRMPENHMKAVRAIQECRTGARGIHIFECPDCHCRHMANSSCGNRHCPVCQHDKTVDWVNKQQHNLLPCNYFLATFTLPEGLRSVARSNQKRVYSALMTQASASLSQLEADQRFVGCGVSGFLGVLHTWSRQLEYHPHVHFLVPGGGLDKNRQAWRSANGDFLVHVRALSKLFRGKMKSAMKQAGLFNQIPSAVWEQDWVVHCKMAGSGKETIKYLGAYVFKVAISDSRIVAYSPPERPGDSAMVKFKYQKVGSSRWRFMVLPVMEFMRRFLQHVLPQGFVKIRRYGFLSPNFSLSIQQIRELICVIYGLVRRKLAERKASLKIRPLRCPECKAIMVWKMFITAWRPVVQT